MQGPEEANGVAGSVNAALLRTGRSNLSSPNLSSPRVGK